MLLRELYHGFWSKKGETYFQTNYVHLQILKKPLTALVYHGFLSKKGDTFFSDKFGTFFVIFQSHTHRHQSGVNSAAARQGFSGISLSLSFFLFIFLSLSLSFSLSNGTNISSKL